MSEGTSTSFLPVYRDKWIQLIGIPVITFFSYYLTYHNIQINLLLAYELLSDAIKILIVWQVIKVVIIELDKRKGWQIGIAKRLLLQIPLTCIAGIIVLTLLVHTEYAFIRPYQLENYFTFDIVIAVIFIGLANTIYVGLYYYDLYLRSISEKGELARKLSEESHKQPEHYIVKVGKKDLVIPYTEIVCFFSEEKETYLVTSTHKTYIVDESLERLETTLPVDYFFRANRKYIITSSVVTTVQTEVYGKLAVGLKEIPKIPASISISREKAPAFRKWLKR